PGNELWRLGLDRSGGPPIYDDPAKLWADCVEYFDWVEANPLYEAELVTYQGASKLERIPKMRAMSQAALCLHLGIGHKTWQTWRKRDLLAEVVERVDAIIWTQKFEGGAAGLLNPMMIARDLGLSDKTELSGRDGGPIRTIDLSKLSDDELAAAEPVLAALVHRPGHSARGGEGGEG